MAAPIIFEQWWGKLGLKLDREGPDSCWLWTGQQEWAAWLCMVTL